METIPAYPLHWPVGWPRTERHHRKHANFGTKSMPRAAYNPKRSLTVADGLDRVMEELRRIGVVGVCAEIIVSTNLQTRRDGLPYSNQREPEDPGVAVYWRDTSKDGHPMRCMAIDRYTRVADNLAAIAASLDALRAVERHGGAQILDRAFAGFSALPPPAQGRPWWATLGVPEDAPTAVVESAYRRLRSQHHPDRGGERQAFQDVQAAYESFRSARNG